MKNKLIAFVMAALTVIPAMADLQGPSDRTVLGLSGFSSATVNPKFVNIVNEKVYSMLNGNPRFHILDVTSKEKAKAQLELTRSEKYIDETDVNVEKIKYAAENLIVGEIIKLPVVKQRVNGNKVSYKANIQFTLKITNTEKGETSDAVSFQAKPSPEMGSAEEAINHVLESLRPEIEQYFREQFPIKAKIAEVITGDAAKGARVVLLHLGDNHGVKVGDGFEVSYMDEELGYPEKIGTMKIQALRGTDHAEAIVDSKGAPMVMSRFNGNAPMDITHIVKSKKK